MSAIVEVEITGREASLVLKYGCPFPEEAIIFEKIAGKQGFHQIAIEECWLKLIVADLSHSIQEVRSLPLCEELDGLCVVFENAIDSEATDIVWF